MPCTGRPTIGAVFAFSGQRDDRTKLLDWDGQGFCLIYKVLQRSRFSWPSAKDCFAHLSCPQLLMLWERIDRRCL
ncbi:IS66 family insertion sequence element accessory protein TnpB [Roseobacter litoralis]|uniref:Transposase, IS66 n=1 Tax=Roseobacter litoralis (strain ATCC 49566 / DSM 6996 / JCM 21268 / NBRC 15278 / OCh 149) TaxID=391595 RepID=F7ZDW7_ROSLO|nr:putative transposase, IS66 [Roseobacter litoralis Och 149]